MQVKKKVLPAKASLLEVEKSVQEHDFEFWYLKRKFSEARKVIEFDTGKNVALADIRRAVDSQCKWWKNKKRPRRNPSKTTKLLPEGWDRLRSAVAMWKNSAPKREPGITLNEAVAIVSITFHCNRSLLQGLTRDWHFWIAEPEKLPRWLKA